MTFSPGFLLLYLGFFGFGVGGFLFVWVLGFFFLDRKIPQNYFEDIKQSFAFSCKQSKSQHHFQTHELLWDWALPRRMHKKLSSRKPQGDFKGVVGWFLEPLSYLRLQHLPHPDIPWLEFSFHFCWVLVFRFLGFFSLFKFGILKEKAKKKTLFKL